jgi:hypothetical protein
MKTHNIIKGALVALTGGLMSCANTSHLLVYQHTNLGLNAGASPQSGNIHARVGLRREFACIVPKVKTPQNEEDTPKIEAASSYVASRVKITSVFKSPEIDEVIATGMAASQLGEKNDAMTPFVKPKS